MSVCKCVHLQVCQEVQDITTTLAVSRIIVGHTIQNSGHPSVLCDGQLIMADVGMSRAVGGTLGDTAAFVCYGETAQHAQHGFGQPSQHAQHDGLESARDASNADAAGHEVRIRVQHEVEAPGVHLHTGHARMGAERASTQQTEQGQRHVAQDATQVLLLHGRDRITELWPSTTGRVILFTRSNV